jgi:hypothetical protein
MTSRWSTLGFAALVMAATLSLSVPVRAAPDAPAPADSHRLVGTVVDFHGKYGLVVRDWTGALRTVVLHQGTIIVPLGLRLERNMQMIVIGGRPSPDVFAADVIVTPYAGPKPVQPFGFTLGPDPRPASSQIDPGNNTARLPAPPERPGPAEPAPPRNGPQ